MSKTYETVIGLEVHVELATKTKIFCGCSTAFGGAPNSHTCPVCTGMPGSLLVLNKQVVEYAMAVGLATNCTITQYCKFDRKNYFYPDNPQNYQISQLYLPICHDGWVEIETSAGKKKVRIHEMHMEEDSLPTSRTDRLTSARMEPSCNLQSDTPRYCIIQRNFSRYAITSSELLMSGSETISISGTPLRL